jgi:hypothetical protein
MGNGEKVNGRNRSPGGRKEEEGEEIGVEQGRK